MRPAHAMRSSAVWIALNEFPRDHLLLIDQWTTHYASKGLTFAGEPVSRAVWGFWSLSFEVAIFFMARRFSLLETGALAWGAGYVVMWLVVGNLGMLPMSILHYAIPWSLLKAFGAVWIVKKRVKVVVLNVGGMVMNRSLPEADQLNYLPRVTQPTLMLNGKHDMFFPVETAQKPMFDLLGTPTERKRLIVYDVGHLVPRLEMVKETLAWYDTYLGKVK